MSSELSSMLRCQSASRRAVFEPSALSLRELPNHSLHLLAARFDVPFAQQIDRDELLLALSARGVVLA